MILDVYLLFKGGELKVITSKTISIDVGLDE